MKKTDLIAREFVRILKRWFRQRYPKTWRKHWRSMQLRNLDYEGTACASHDYFDANCAMEAACSKYGVDIFYKRKEGMNQRAVDTWNKAWDIAKRDYLTA